MTRFMCVGYIQWQCSCLLGIFNDTVHVCSVYSMTMFMFIGYIQWQGSC